MTGEERREDSQNLIKNIYQKQQQTKAINITNKE